MGDFLFYGSMLGLALIYYKYTNADERAAGAQRRHEFNNRVVGGGFSIISYFLKRLK